MGHLILLTGMSSTGKTSAQESLEDHKSVMYLGAEGKKGPPFKNKFQNFKIDDPYQVHEALEYALTEPSIKTVIIDSLPPLLNMFVEQHIKTAKDTRSAWGLLPTFFYDLLNKYVAPVVDAGKNVIILSQNNIETTPSGELISVIPVQGNALQKNGGIEAYFDIIIRAKAVDIQEVKPYVTDKNKLLHITEEETINKMKYVFQTRASFKSPSDRIRSPKGIFNQDQLYIDSDMQQLIKHLDKYYE
jgi:hypothetical protein